MYQLSEIELRVYKTIKERLKQEGFNPRHWSLKEIPLDDELFIFQNLNGSVEFTAVRDVDKNGNEHIVPCYITMDKTDCIQDNEANSIIEAIELDDWYGRGITDQGQQLVIKVCLGGWHFGGKGSNVRNILEDNIVDHFEARPMVIATVNAINNCPEKPSWILRQLYLEGLSDAEVERRSIYSHSTYQDKKKDAWLWFADAFQNTIMMV